LRFTGSAAHEDPTPRGGRPRRWRPGARPQCRPRSARRRGRHSRRRRGAAELTPPRRGSSTVPPTRRGLRVGSSGSSVPARRTTPASSNTSTMSTTSCPIMRATEASSQGEREGVEDGGGGHVGQVVDRERALDDVVEELVDLGPPVRSPLGRQGAHGQQRAHGPVEGGAGVGGDGRTALGGDDPAVGHPQHAGLLGPGEHQAEPAQFGRAPRRERPAADPPVHDVAGLQEVDEGTGVRQGQVPGLGELATVTDEVGQAGEQPEDGSGGPGLGDRAVLGHRDR
jgi:hypothetical protein